MKNNEDRPALSAPSKGENALDLTAIATSAAPWIGGPISQIISGIATNLKIKRVSAFLEDILSHVEELHNEASERFVRTEDFIDIFEKTAQDVANERSEKKRALFARYLLSNIASPEITYDHRLKILRILEQIDTRHVDLLRALLQKPTAAEIDRSLSAPSTTLEGRAPHLYKDAEALIHETNQLRLTKIHDNYMNVNMTGHGAANLAHVVTELGRDLVSWLQEQDAN